MAGANRAWSSLKAELGYFGGLVWLAERRSGGAILKFERVRPRRDERFQPLKAREIAPEFLERAIRALRRWNYDIVSIDQLSARLERPDPKRRFVCLGFDGASRDLITWAYPLLARHRVPFTVYLPTAFPDGLGEAWWLALEQVIARHDRIALVIDRKERRFDTAEVADKYRAFAYLGSWMRTLPPPDLSLAINDLSSRYAVDLAALTREAAISWDDIATLAADPLVSFGSATVNYPVLAALDEATARREITMGRAVAEAALRRELPHFAYPFGDCDAFGPAHVRIVQQAGFASAVTAVPGVLRGGAAIERFALPRLTWDGRRRSLRRLRAMLAGVAD